VCNGKIQSERPKLGGNNNKMDLGGKSSENLKLFDRMMRLAGHVVHMGAKRVHTRFWWGNLKERDYWEDLGTDGSIIF
jgi:hypothetical protein